MLNYNLKETTKEIIDEDDPLPPIDQCSTLKVHDVSKNASLTGCKSHHLNRKRKTRHSNSCCHLFSSSEPSTTGNESMFVTREGWGDSNRLQFSSEHGKIVHKVSLVKDNQSISDMTGRDLSEEVPQVKADFKTLLTMFFKKSSIYALNQIGNSASSRRKFFWAFILIVGLAGSIIQIGQYLSSYFAYPVVVNIDTVHSLNQEFPAVTVCNLNIFPKEFLPCLHERLTFDECIASGKNNYEEIKIDYTFFFNGSWCKIDGFGNLSSTAIQTHFWKNSYAVQDEKNQGLYGHQVSDLVRSCFFNGEECDPDMFRPSVDNEYGNCFTFNSAFLDKNPLNTSFVGPNGGLELELNVEVERYTYFARAVGARVKIHDPRHLPNLIDRGVSVSPGFETSITLKKIQMKRLPKPYKDMCENYAVGDNVKTCYGRCLDENIAKSCLCYVLNNSYNDRRCDMSKSNDLCCFLSVKFDNCDCPLSCDDTDYDINVYSAEWPSGNYYSVNPIEIAGNKMDITDVRRTMMKVKIFYDSLETVVYKQNPKYQNSELFSQIGGQMGLWLGLSLVAIFECFENFIILWQYRASQSQESTRDY